jgi:hypothetical protein
MTSASSPPLNTRPSGSTATANMAVVAAELGRSGLPARPDPTPSAYT